MFNLIGADAVYCAEAAFWLDGTVGGQIGTAIQKKFLAWPAGQQLLAGRGSAISGEWVLYRKLATCGVHDCQLNVMDVTISCAGGSCSVIRTNGSSNGAPPWDHAIPFAFSNGAWRGSGKEQNAAVCGKSPVPGTGVSLTLKVISGGIADGVWRAKQLSGTLDIANVATKCDSNAVTSHEVVSTTPF